MLKLRFTFIESSSHPQDLSILVISDRSAQLEPCGCSIVPRGGIVRERNLLQKWRGGMASKSVYFSVGTQFVPPSVQYNPERIPRYLLDDKLLVKAMNEVSTTAAFIQPEDLNLGIDAVKALERGAKFPFVSSNLYHKGKVIFVPYVELSQFNPPLLLIGLSEASPYYPIPSGVEVMDPADAVARVLSRISKKERFVIVASNLSREAKKNMLTKFPEINLFIGGSDADGNAPRDQLAEHTLTMSAMNQGRELTRLDFTLKLGTPLYFNPELTARIGRPVVKTQEAVSYQFVSEILEKNYDNPNNDFSSWIEKHQAELRKQGMDEGDE